MWITLRETLGIYIALGLSYPLRSDNQAALPTLFDRWPAAYPL